MVQFCGALFNLGKALGMQGRADEATKAYGRAIEVLASGSAGACCPECNVLHLLKVKTSNPHGASLFCLNDWWQPEQKSGNWRCVFADVNLPNLYRTQEPLMAQADTGAVT